MSTPQWWQDCLAYQIYPRSFADSNGDGIGDLEGARRKLDYLQDLGVGAVWFSPFFPSPLKDVGYDVSDYCDIAPEYGGLAAFDQFQKEARQRGIRVILDFVMNHTSDEHPWFQKSRRNRNAAHRDWYVWHDPRPDGSPPNNWESVFGGPAWEWDERTGQYYYHNFLKEQPDLNWHNPAVRAAMLDVVRFWLDRGVDGFRLDAVGTLFEADGLPDNDVPLTMMEAWQLNFQSPTGWSEEFGRKIRFQTDDPRVHEVMRELRALVDTYPGAVLLGESDDVRYYGRGADELHSVFNFGWTNIAEPNAERIRAMLKNRLPKLPAGAWECQTLGNHDRARAWGHIADGRHDAERYLACFALTFFLPGTPMIYYGEEIGMQDYYLTDPAQQRDNLGVWIYQSLLDQGHDSTSALRESQKLVGRDKCRTPMQWDSSPHAGFSSPEASPWLPLHPNYPQINVAAQLGQGDSIYEQFKTLTQVRRDYAPLRRGSFQLISNSGPVLAFWRKGGGQDCLVAINMSAEPQRACLGMARLRRLYSSSEGARRPGAAERSPAQYDLADLRLGAYEVFVGGV
jgi:alpha-glucosidase